MSDPSEAPRSRAEGSVFAGKYRIIRRVGRGSMATVYEAERLADGVRVALKLMRKELSDDPKARHRFEREGRLGASIDSQHIVRVLDSGVDAGTGAPFLCMEFVSADTLADWLERGPFNPMLASLVLSQLFDAVAAAHRTGVVHRDLKPENVFLPTPSDGTLPTVKVADFGVAKSMHAASLLRTEAGLGTPLWTAPEQAKTGYVPSPESDAWALGLITYAVLTGRNYFKNAGTEGSLMNLAQELISGPIAPPSVRAAEQGVERRIPIGFDAWFARMVNRDPSQRFSDAGRAWQGLAPLLGIRMGRRTWVWVALIGVFLVLLGTGFLLRFH